MRSKKGATFDELVATLDSQYQPIARRLREIIRETLPDATETVWTGGWKIALYSDGGGICGIGPGRQWVQFHLTKGSQLPDPDKLLEGRGKGIRNVKVRSLEAIPVEGIRNLIRESRRITSLRGSAPEGKSGRFG